jgi:CspA family cold shock protein
LTCEICGKTFVFTVTEQRKLHKMGKGGDGEEIVPPTHCPGCRTFDKESGRWSGRIKWFNHERGYGFIARQGDEVFFHRSQLIDIDLANLDEGLEVTFEQVSTDRGPEARQVKIGSR